jgi:hypothetical protein
MASDLTRLPLAVSTDWLSKTVTNNPPRLTPHTEWRLAIRLAASVEFRFAVVLYSPAKMRWGLRPEPPARDAEVMLHFFPHSWSSSDLVQINWGWQRVTVTDPEMKRDPRAYATVLSPEDAVTGKIVSVCAVERHGLTAAVLALAREDTEARRSDRWRVRPERVSHLPQSLVAMSSGRQSGFTHP